MILYPGGWNRKFFMKILKQILLLISCFFSSLIVKFGEIHKLGFMSWIGNPEAHHAPTPVFDCDTEDFPGEPSRRRRWLP
jgi:hypothetical protein